MKPRFWAIALAAITLLAPAATGMTFDGATVGSATGATSLAQDSTTEIDSCQAIEEPGTYVLTQDLEPTELVTASGGERYVESLTGCLVIAPSAPGDRIHIDGNGHTISGESVGNRTPSDVADGSAISSVGGAVTVTNVTVTGWKMGVESRESMKVDAVTATENDVGVLLSFAGGDLTNSTLSENERGLVFSVDWNGGSPVATGFDISDNRITNNAEGGVWLSGGFGGSITDNVISDNGGSGIEVGAENTEFRGNTVSGNGEHGLDAYGGELAIVGNAFTHNQGAGVNLDDDRLDPPQSTLHRNHIEGNGAGVSVAVITEPEDLDEEATPSAPYDGMVNATNNYWGDPQGPSSETGPDAPLEDPVTGTLACGPGDSVSEGNITGVSNVHFDPYLSDSPLNNSTTT